MDDCQHLLQDQNTGNAPQLIHAPALRQGMRFESTEDLKVAVEHFYASQGKGVKHGQSGSRQREFRCSGSRLIEGTKQREGCLAVIRATKQANHEWRISSMMTSHKNCSGVKRKVSVITAGRIASKVLSDTPNITGKELKAEIESRIGGTLSLRSAHRAKRAALAGRLAPKKICSHLQTFLADLTSKCPGTITDFEEDDDNTFRRCFLMLGNIVRIVTQSVPKEKRALHFVNNLNAPSLADKVAATHLEFSSHGNLGASHYRSSGTMSGNDVHYLVYHGKKCFRNTPGPLLADEAVFDLGVLDGYVGRPPAEVDMEDFPGRLPLPMPTLSFSAKTTEVFESSVRVKRQRKVQYQLEAAMSMAMRKTKSEVQA